MDSNMNEEYQSPDGDLTQDLDFDLDDEDYDENGDLLRIVGIAGGVAAIIGGLIILLGRHRQTPTERLLEQVGSTGKDVRKAVEKADLGGLLSEALAQANKRVRSVDVADLARSAAETGRAGVRSAGAAAGRIDLESTISELQQRLSAMEHDGRRGARRAQKEARRAFNDLDLSSLPQDVGQQLGDLWDEVSARAKDVGWDQAIDESRNQVRKLNRSLRRRNIDVGAFGALLAALAAGLGGSVENVQKNVVPQVQSTLEDDVLPEARKRARQAGETLSAVADEARKRGGKLADDVGPQVKKQAGRTAEGAKGLSSQVGDMLRVVALEALDRVISDVLPGARKGGERVASTVLDDTFPWLRHRAGEVRDRIQDDVAPRVRDAAAEAPGRVRDAVGAAAPVVGDALSSAAGTVGDAVSRARPKVGEAVDAGRAKAQDAVQSGSSGVGGALSTAGRKAGDAVGATVDTTKYVTGETGRILFWLSMLSGMILMVFVPDPDRQKEIWNNVQQFLGEIRNMWGDLGADNFESDPAQEYTGDAGV